MGPPISICGCVRPSDGRMVGPSVGRMVLNPFFFKCQKWTIFFIKIIGQSNFDIAECAECSECAYNDQGHIVGLLGLVFHILRKMVQNINSLLFFSRQISQANRAWP